MNVEPERFLPLDSWCAKRLGAGENDEHYGPLPRAALLRRQCAALADTVRRAASNSAHYARVIGRDAAGFFASRLCTLAASAAPDEKSFLNVLTELPFTSPSELADAPESFLAVPHDEVEGLISVPSTGSSGKLKRVFCSGADLELTVDFFANGMRVMLHPERGERVAMIMSGSRRGGTGDLFGRAMARLGVATLVTGFPGDESELMDALAGFAPTCMVGHPLHLFALARRPDAAKLRGTMRSVLITGDAVPDAVARVIGGAFGAVPFRHYGLTEIGLGGAVECVFGAGCHMRELDFVAEITAPDGSPLGIDPASGATGWGEVTLTTLTRLAMPLIRYRTGDVGRIVASPCECGSALRRLEVMGRASEFVPDVRAKDAVHSAELDAALSALPWAKSWRVACSPARRRAERTKQAERTGGAKVAGGAGQGIRQGAEHELLVCVESLPQAPSGQKARAEIMESLSPLMSRLDQNAVKVYAVAKAPAFFHACFAEDEKKRGILRTDSETIRRIAVTTVAT